MHEPFLTTRHDALGIVRRHLEGFRHREDCIQAIARWGLLVEEVQKEVHNDFLLDVFGIELFHADQRALHGYFLDI